MLIWFVLAACGGAPTPDAPQPKQKVEAKGKKSKGKAKGKASAKAKKLQERASKLFGVPKKVARNKDNKVSDAKVELGRTLYYETRISKNNKISCNSCHMLDKYGVDGEPTSPGHEGKRGDRNSPTTYYAAFHVAQFWDGREPDVEAQAKGPVLNPVEMGMPDDKTVIKTLKGIKGYPKMFKDAFPEDADPLTYDNFGKAVGAFERKLVTPSPFDKFLEGDVTALNDRQIEGLDLFISTGCTACHSGELLGGKMYQKLGAVEPYKTEDLGRYNVTKNDADKYVFKVPSLRNVAETGPYFHDGQVKGLKKAVKLMAKHQLGKEMSDEDAEKISAFLKSLTGEIDQEYIKAPKLPGM